MPTTILNELTEALERELMREPFNRHDLLLSLTLHTHPHMHRGAIHIYRQQKPTRKSTKRR